VTQAVLLPPGRAGGPAGGGRALTVSVTVTVMVGPGPGGITVPSESD
jgi:hypothetical protein